MEYNEFASWDIIEKVDFLDSFFDDAVYVSYVPSLAKLLLHNIFLNESNSYIRLQALSNYNELVLLKILNANSLIGLLIDDIDDQDDIFIQIKKIRLLFLYASDIPCLNEALDKLSNHINAEVASEALFRQGLMYFLEAVQLSDNQQIDNFRNAITYFSKSAFIVENRVDAKYYQSVCNLFLILISGENKNISSILEETLSLLWNLKLFSNYQKEFDIESKIAVALTYLVNISINVGQETDWVNYRDSFLDVFELHQKFLTLEVDSNIIEQKRFSTFLKNTSLSVLSPLYQYNFTAATSKLNVVLQKEPEGTEFYCFLKEIAQSLKGNNSKKKETTTLIATLARRFQNISIEQITFDISTIDVENNLEIISLVSNYSETRFEGYLTGFPIGDEVLSKLKHEILKKIPSYPTNKLFSFTLALADTIKYVVRSMQEKKEFFPELYNPLLITGRTEHIFQESLFKSLRHSKFAYRYFYEPNQSGGGRIDITYNDDALVFPIEVKKSSQKPTWNQILSDYLAQAQTYTNSYDQLGIFVVFDLSPKKGTITPINDLRELFMLQSVEALYNLSNKYPDFVVSVIVPANKVSPSSMSKYS